MNLKSSYLGIDLKNPIIASSSTLTGNIEDIEKLANAGVGAIVLRSLFEEEILADMQKLDSQSDMYFWYPKATELINQLSKKSGVNNYLDLIKNAKDRVEVPVIASINCFTENNWPEYASKIEAVGADGLELNIYIPPSDASISSQDIEERYITIIKSVQENTRLPIGIKIGYYFTNLRNFVARIAQTGIKGLVLFNRYYRPDININNLSMVSGNNFSTSSELTPLLRWITLLFKDIPFGVSASSGVHTSEDLIKVILSGASSVHIASTLYINGAGQVGKMLEGLEKWMQTNSYSSIDDFKAKVASLPEAQEHFERIQFIQKTFGV
jgi:dihydroorotate dehydrogenase (fumarate)